MDIYLNGRVCRVRQNLWSCLHYIGRKAQELNCFYLWVDAICINQGDTTERSAQVNLMDQIYRQAASVSVWLGLAPMPEVYQPFRADVPIRTLDVDHIDWEESMPDIANRPYWSRVWVIQEFLLGRDVWLHCSNLMIHWQDFQEILCRVEGVEQFILPPNNSPNLCKPNTSVALPLVMGRHIDKHPETLQPLQRLLIEHSHSNCKDPRDRVFAMLGLVTQDERMLLGRIFPNYALSADHVLILTVAHLVQFGPLIPERQSYDKITPESDEVFEGLRVHSKSQRKWLLSRAARLDYIGILSGDEALRILKDHDFDDEIFPGRIVNDYVPSATGENDDGESGNGVWRYIKKVLKVVLLFSIAGIGIAALYSKDLLGGIHL
jgi:hypothetical protein